MKPARFYLPDGSTCAGLREARKSGNAVPSVTTITSLYPRYALQDWLNRQLWESTVTTPRYPNEADNNYYARCQEHADEIAAAARDRGNRAHDMLTGTYEDYVPEDLSNIWKCFNAWRNPSETQIWSERVLFGTDYAGRADRLMTISDDRLFLDDFKIRSKPAIYPEDGIQLSAYLNALPACDWWRTTCRSIVIASDGSEIKVKEWTEDEMNGSYQIFRHLHAIWCHANNYYPISRTAFPQTATVPQQPAFAVPCCAR